MAVVNYLVTNDVSKLADGQAMYTCCCNERGTILDDFIVYRADQENWVVVVNAHTGKVTARVKLAFLAEFALDQRTGTLYVRVYGTTELLALNGARLQPVASFPQPRATFPGVFAFDGNTGVLYAADNDTLRLFRP